jgi:lipopolysaccharide heptosyltransferase I
VSKSLKNILIIKPSSLGDIVLALPALTALHKSFSDARISWLIRPEFAPLLENHPHLNDTIIFDRKFLGKAWFHPRALASLLSLIRRLRRSKFDAVIDLQGLFRTASLAWLSGCKERLGMANARELAHIFYTHKTKRQQDCIHVVDYYLKVIQAMGASKTQVQFVLPTEPTVADSVNTLLINRDIKPDNYAVFVPGSAQEAKCWPAHNFASLAEKMVSQFGFSIIVVGTNAEKSITEKIVSGANVQVIDLAGLTSLPELVALFRSAKIVVSNDTGPGHIAAALGVPLVMIFGPSNPVRLLPYKRPETLAAVEPFGRGLKLQSNDPAHAIEAITVDQVYQKVCEQMEQKPNMR